MESTHLESTRLESTQLEGNMNNGVKFKQLAPDMYVAGQLEVSDMERALALGVNTLICNRPDGEADQTSSAAMAAAAQAVGIRFVYLPMASPGDAARQRDGFIEALADGGVILAYCRSGRRSTVLWQESTQK